MILGLIYLVMQKGRRRHIPAFGEWNQQCEELPITQYFDSAMEQGLVVTAGHYYHATAGELLFKVAGSPPPQKPPKKASILWPVLHNIFSACTLPWKKTLKKL